MGVKCIGIQTSQAAKSLFQFWEEIFKILSSRNSVQGMANLLKLIVDDGYGSACLKGMFEVLVGNFPEQVICEFIDDVIINILLNVRPQSESWFMQALEDVPQSVLNNGEKLSFVNNLREKDYTLCKDYYTEFFDKFYRRCKTYNSKIY